MQKIEHCYFTLVAHQRPGNENSIPRTSCQPPVSAQRSFLTPLPTYNQVGKEKAGRAPGDLVSLLSSWLEFLLPTNPHFDHTPTATQIFEFSNSFSGFSEALAA